MSEKTTMSQHVFARFEETFGPPHNTLGRDFHWGFQSPNAPPINVLLNGTVEDAIVWIFDSHDRADGVHAITVSQEGQVDPIITQIQQRVQRASHTA